MLKLVNNAACTTIVHVPTVKKFAPSTSVKTTCILNLEAITVDVDDREGAGLVCATSNVLRCVEILLEYLGSKIIRSRKKFQKKNVQIAYSICNSNHHK